MKLSHDILRALGRIEGELIEIRKLSQRVSVIERWHWWLKGAWAVIAAALVVLSRHIYWR